MGPGINPMSDHEESQNNNLALIVLALEILSKMPSKAEKVSRDTQSFMQKVKIPLVLLCPVSGMSAAMSVSFFLGFSTSVTNPDGIFHFQTFIYLSIITGFACMQLFSINRAMKLYQ